MTASRRPRAQRVSHPFARWVAVLALLGGVSLSGVLPSPAYAAPTPTDCGYGTAGPAADTLCWFNMAGYSEALATSAAGQPFTVALGGGYTASFTLTKTAVPNTVYPAVTPRTAPLEARFAYGTVGYAGVPGSPILYSTNPAGGTKALVLTLSDIAVTDAGGAVVTGYRFVIADAENNVNGESFTWTSDENLETVAVLNPASAAGCALPLPGIGTTQVTCTGTGGGNGPYNGVLVGAESPSFISLRMSTFALSGVAFAIQTAKLTVSKDVAGRVDAADAFDIAIRSPENTVVATASTGAASTATTGSTIVLPRLDGSAYTLVESASAGSPSPLGYYTQAWQCENAKSGSTTALPSGTGSSVSVSPAPGDDIRCTVTNAPKSAAIGIVKHAGTPTDVNADGLVDAGDTIPYTFDVSNTGQLPLSDVAVDDPLVGAVTCPQTTLEPGASTTCASVSPYEVTPADVVAGSVENSATASALRPGSATRVVSAASTTSTPTTAPAPGITLVKSASPSAPSDYHAGQLITYTFVVTNSGNVPLHDVDITEGVFTGSGPLSAISCPELTAPLAPSDQLVCTASYTLTVADANAGGISNTATATALPPEGPAVTSTSTAPLPVTPAPALTLEKSVSDGATRAGETIAYSFRVTNTGNVTVSSLAIVETAFDGAGAMPEPQCGVTVLAPGQDVVCTADYALEQADVDRGSVENTARATALAPDATPVSSGTSSATATIARTAALSLEKTATPSGPTAFRAGERIVYAFLVTNTGNVTLTDVTVAEASFEGTGTLLAPSCPAAAASVAPGADVTCTTEYVLTQEDIDRGSITNAATATGTPPAGVPAPETAEDAVTVPAAAAPGLTLVKTADIARVTRAGEVVTYTFAISNTGNTTLVAPSVEERDFSGAGRVGDIACPDPAPSFAPGDVVTCELRYTVVSDDLTGAALENTAVASAVTLDGEAIASAASTATVSTTDLAMTGLSDVWPVVVAAAALVVLGGGAIALAVVRRRRER